MNSRTPRRGSSRPAQPAPTANCTGNPGFLLDVAMRLGLSFPIPRGVSLHDWLRGAR